MIRYRVVLVNFLFIIVFLSIVKSARAVAMNFTVHGGEEEIKTISLAVEDHVLIRFTIVGQSDSSLWFYIAYPNGTVKENFGKVGYLEYSFVCSLKGDYLLHFSNVDSGEDKLVTLECEIEHYILGIPQMLFLTIIIVLVCMVAVAAFILMGKTH